MSHNTPTTPPRWNPGYATVCGLCVCGLYVCGGVCTQIGTDFLEEEITKFEDLVQSVDIAAFNKI